MKLEPESKKELGRIAGGTAICTAAMWVVFAALHTVGWARFDSSVILGSLVGALVAIGNFTQPSYELSYAFKLTRLLILALTAVFGAWGFWAGQAVLVLLLATNRTVSGGSYLYPLFPFDAQALRGVFLRGPMNRENS